MPSTFYATLFAACAAAANITTSIWLPGAANANETFLASVVEQSGDQTILALAFASTPSAPDYFTSAPDRATVGGNTFVAYNVTASDSDGPNAASITIGMHCTRASGGVEAVPTCTLSTLGVGRLISDLCAGLTLQYSTNNYPLIITAGTEKLGASAAATPSPSSATPTTATVGSG
ncbi:hypothetical protein CC86DRAFT_288909 [Ophiobolus disseminans]|uniref:Uncharacterized protein n=1 Tax=Ophiobolus disseminans TaxID=1469910 RepID=A0A6A7A6A6_9PLEO|nr:hypothetical protein CC86DRAFT_288909 [Ophiobolus disseminans]